MGVFHQRLRGQANNVAAWHAASQIVGKTLLPSDILQFDKPSEFVHYNLKLKSAQGHSMNPKLYDLYQSPQELSLWTETHANSGARTKFDPKSKKFFDHPVEYFSWQSEHKDEIPSARAK